MDDALGDSFSIKVGEEVDEMKVLKEEWAILADSLRLVGMRHGNAVGSGVNGIFGHGASVPLIVPKGGGGVVATQDTILLRSG